MSQAKRPQCHEIKILVKAYVMLRKTIKRKSVSLPSANLYVELKGLDSFLQHPCPLLLRQLHAVHPAAVELFEPVGAWHARKGEERHTLAALQPQGLLGNAAKDLTPGQVTQVTGICVGKQELWILSSDLGEWEKEEGTF